MELYFEFGPVCKTEEETFCECGMFRDLLWKRGSKRVVEVGKMEMMEPSVIFDGLILASRFVPLGYGFFVRYSILIDV